MKNKFVLDLPENGFGFPCNICANRTAPASECADCVGYLGPFVADEFDLRKILEQPAYSEPIK